MRRGPIWVTTVVTYDCNKKCNHCYMKRLDRQHHAIISTKVIDRIVLKYREFVSKFGLSGGWDSFPITGGEPTLVMDSVMELVDKLRSTEFDGDFHTSVFTNGIALNENILKWFVDKNVGLRLSVNDSSLDFLEDRMKLISVYKGRNFGLQVILTPESLDRLNLIIDLAHKYSNYFRLRHERYNTTPDYVDHYCKVVPEAIQYILDKNYGFDPLFMFEMINTFWPLDIPFYSVCGRCYYTVDPDGMVRSCPAGDKTIGSIFDEDFSIAKTLKGYTRKHIVPLHTYKGIPECEQCKFKNICGGGCPLSKEDYYHIDDPYRRPSPFCGAIKKVLPIMIQLTERFGKNKHSMSMPPFEHRKRQLKLK